MVANDMEWGQENIEIHALIYSDDSHFTSSNFQQQKKRQESWGKNVIRMNW